MGKRVESIAQEADVEEYGGEDGTPRVPLVLPFSSLHPTTF